MVSNIETQEQSNQHLPPSHGAKSDASTQLNGNEKAHKTPGEKKFDAITYKGIAWLGAAGLGITIAQVLEHGKGKALFDKAIDYLAPRYQNLMHTDTKTAREAMSSAMTHASFISGVSLVVPPVKWLEDKKYQTVVKWDNKINERRQQNGNPLSEEELAAQEKAHARIKAEPKQTWPSLLVGRALGVSSVFFPAIFLVKGKDKKLLENVAEKLTTNKAAQSLGVLVALEVGYTFISEEVLHFTSKLYAKKKHTEEERQILSEIDEKPFARLNQINEVQANNAREALSLRA